MTIVKILESTGENTPYYFKYKIYPLINLLIFINVVFLIFESIIHFSVIKRSVNVFSHGVPSWFLPEIPTTFFCRVANKYSFLLLIN